MDTNTYISNVMHFKELFPNVTGPIIGYVVSITGIIIGAIIAYYGRIALRKKLQKSFDESMKKLKDSFDESSKSLKKSNDQLHFLIKELAGETSKLVNSNKPELWGDFSEPDFKSYNDPWVMELLNPNNFKEVHQRRYKNPYCPPFNFLFFTKSNNIESWDPFIKFVKFQSIVHLGLEPEDISDIAFDKKLVLKLAELEKTKSLNEEDNWRKTIEHINVFINSELERPLMTFFRGYKNDKELALLYFSNNLNEELPHITIQITDKKTWDALDKTWDNAASGLAPINGIKIFEKYLELKKLIK